MVEPAADGAVAEVGQALAATGEGDAVAGQVDVDEFQTADGTGAGGVLGGQGDDVTRENLKRVRPYDSWWSLRLPTMNT